jgi:hypothetical protein
MMSGSGQVRVIAKPWCLEQPSTPFNCFSIANFRKIPGNANFCILLSELWCSKDSGQSNCSAGKSHMRLSMFSFLSKLSGHSFSQVKKISRDYIIAICLSIWQSRDLDFCVGLTVVTSRLPLLAARRSHLRAENS